MNQRLSRRRALAATGATAAGAALLAACGGDDGGDSKGDSSGLVFKPTDRTKEAKIGGVFKWYNDNDIPNLEPHATQRGSRNILCLTYSKYLNLKPGYLEPSTYEVEPEIIESWEVAPDGLTLTMKLRQGVGFSPQAPANGRMLDIDDMKYNWQRWEEKAQTRAEWINALNPQAPVLNLTTPDARTLVYKLAFPSAGLLTKFGTEPKHPFIMGKDTEQVQGGVRTNTMGTGPWYLSEYTPSGRYVLKRNPNYWDKSKPYIETIERPIISEYSTLLAQFRTGSIYTLLDDLRPDDVLQLKKDVPQLDMYQIPAVSGSGMTFFGWKPDGKTPFRDVRMRQALSMSRDRDQFIDAFFNVTNFESQGLPVEVRWSSTAIGPDLDGWWIDPRDKKFGPNSKYFEHNIAEAKKLMAAAGFPNGIDVIANWPTDGLGVDFNKIVEVYHGMGNDAGFRFTPNNPNYAEEWPSKFRDARGNFDGLAYQNSGNSDTDAIERFVADYSPVKSNTLFTGFDPDGKGTFGGDPKLDDLIARGRKEFDTEKRREIVYEIQRYLGGQMYQFRSAGSATGFELLWPALANHRTYRRPEGHDRYPETDFIDETKAPIAKT